MDALDLLAIAQRAGLSPCRARRLRETLMRPTASEATVDRVERVLRSWVDSRHTLRLRL
jgi:hypothetical protein